MGLRWTILLAVCAAGAVSDLKKGIIPNRILLTGFAAEAAGLLWTEPLITLGAEEAKLCFITIGTMVLFSPLFFLDLCGAGDVKLASLIFGSVGMYEGLRVLFWGGLPAAVWSLGVMLSHGILRQRIQWVYEYLRTWMICGRPAAYPVGITDRNTGTAIRLAPFLLIGVLWEMLFGG
ncbi:Type IV leader peptidase family protein [[Clostridium] aminophilum]|uniref:Type IV leader peptidase family protein n=1 Tax=[Clostridium] aminophilum TaxID=1526 RepID=A0A1I0HCX9_9FIRM|nr:A24 family peptidase [[Clostridium] aminophilum]SET81730.1 Type IV leader peptidase family protein [[Clostridium] aminophilum]